MKLWYEPEVYVLAQTQVNEAEFERFITDHGYNRSPVLDDMMAVENKDCDILPEFAGRMCYMSFDKGRPSKEYIQHILEVGHGSVLEHTNITLGFVGVSRTLTHELVRHRAGFAYSQLSQRFVNEENVGFVIPPLMLDNPNDIAALEVQLSEALASYKAFVASKMEELSSPSNLVEFAIRGGELHQQEEDAFTMNKDDGYPYHRSKAQWIDLVGRDEQTKKDFRRATFSARKKTALEASRSVLPNCTETKITVTANGRAWRHFLGMRGSIHADREIRRLACKVAGVLKESAPLLFQDVEIQVNPGDGLPYVTLGYEKV